MLCQMLGITPHLRQHSLGQELGGLAPPTRGSVTLCFICHLSVALSSCAICTMGMTIMVALQHCGDRVPPHLSSRQDKAGIEVPFFEDTHGHMVSTLQTHDLEPLSTFFLPT